MFANDIASLNFRPQTAAAQYTAADAAWKKNNEELEGLNKRINEIQDNAPIARPFDDEISAVQADFVLVEEKELESCKDITCIRKISTVATKRIECLVLAGRIGEYQFTTVDRVIFFLQRRCRSGMQGQDTKKPLCCADNASGENTRHYEGQRRRG